MVEMMKRSPRQAFILASQFAGLPDDLFERAHEIFSSATLIDIHPIGTKKDPGLMIILDRKFSLWFYKKNGHYTYDGFEIGEYTSPHGRESADLTI